MLFRLVVSAAIFSQRIVIFFGQLPSVEFYLARIGRFDRVVSVFLRESDTSLAHKQLVLLVFVVAVCLCRAFERLSDFSSSFLRTLPRLESFAFSLLANH